MRKEKGFDMSLEQVTKKRKQGLRYIKDPLSWLLFISFLLSIFTLVLYFIGSRFSDEFLFFLLSVSKYSAVIALLCSIYKLLRNLVYIFYRPSFYRIIKILGFAVIIIYCAGIFYFEAFIFVIAGGNE